MQLPASHHSHEVLILLTISTKTAASRPVFARHHREHYLSFPSPPLPSPPLRSSPPLSGKVVRLWGACKQLRHLAAKHDLASSKPAESVRIGTSSWSLKLSDAIWEGVHACGVTGHRCGFQIRICLSENLAAPGMDAFTFPERESKHSLRGGNLEPSPQPPPSCQCRRPVNLEAV